MPQMGHWPGSVFPDLGMHRASPDFVCFVNMVFANFFTRSDLGSVVAAKEEPAKKEAEGQRSEGDVEGFMVCFHDYLPIKYSILYT